MSADEFAAAMREANLTGCRSEFVERLRRLDDAELYHLLYPLAVSSQLECPAACGAAMLLAELRPACPVSCRDALLTAMPTWDVGIREVPEYLAAIFGHHRLLQVVRELAKERFPNAMVARLRQIAYFLRVPDEERLSWRGSKPAT
jgi:hypothetical protein